MSTELKPTMDRNDAKILMTQYWGGAKYGTCIQLTGENDYIVLDKPAAKRLIEALNEWVEGIRSEANEDEKS